LKSKLLITVLIDTYNHERFIEEAICSVLEQDFPASDAEILVVDDGSTDRTPDIVRKFEPHVHLLRKNNGGQASAFNVGVQQARGEIIAFLDGDDWWAQEKLSAVAEALDANPDVGLIGHGLTEVSPDGRRRTEVPRESMRFRISSVEDAKKFRMLRGFLGTSRMAYRRDVLRRVGSVPEALVFEADEYLFTLASIFAEVLILRGALTFYRVHGENLFQLSNGDPEAGRRKQRVLTLLAQSLREEITRNRVPDDVARAVLECVEVEAEALRLGLDGGFPWETVWTELRLMRIFHSDASFWQHLISCVRLVPAVVLPSATYYRLRRAFASLSMYQKLRRTLLPFPVPRQVERIDRRDERVD
jgi:glycosyltransferase involved in cell wall biosynthesis